ncbi:MAG: hypothetical protein LUD38_14315, partial [Parabacteroides sp.]|nr:hypothetical protein [Parabacteroides sp.]
MTIADKLGERGSDDIQERFGFVLMLDGLGVSKLDQKGQYDWLRRRNKMIHSLDDQQQLYLNKYNDLVQSQLAFAEQNRLPEEAISELKTALDIYKEIQHSSSFAAFGDTIIFHGSVPEKYASPENNFYFISQISLSLHEVMKANIKFDLRLRGSIALGNFLAASKSDTIMGEALIEAYNSYERANWIGIIIAPGSTEAIMNEAQCVLIDLIQRFGLETLATRNDWWNLGITYPQSMASFICNTIIKYPVQYKQDNGEQGHRKSWAAAWGLALHIGALYAVGVRS